MSTKQKIKIIIADDHPIFRSGLIKVIEEDPEIEVIGEAENGEKAFSLILEHKPDIALLDIHMPIMTGLQILKEFKRERYFLKLFFSLFMQMKIFSMKQWITV